jgi:hypothetical protein
VITRNKMTCCFTNNEDKNNSYLIFIGFHVKLYLKELEFSEKLPFYTEDDFCSYQQKKE